MKKILFVTGVFIIVMTFGIVITGCDSDDGGGGKSTTYTVSYDVGSGSGTAPANQTVTSGANITLPGKGNMTAPSGQNFNGWRTNGQNYSAGDSYTVTNNTTFVAQWAGSNNNNNDNNNNNNNNNDNNNNNTGNTSVPSAPTNVNASAVSSSSITISWSSVSTATSYDVYYAGSSSAVKSLAGNVTGTSYSHTGLLASTTYYYFIKAKNSAGSSDYSSSTFATTLSSSVAGSSASTAITITSGGSISGSFPAGLDAVWYKFTTNGSGYLGAIDKEYSSTYTSDIVVDVFSSSLNLISGPIYNAGTYLSNGRWEDIDVGKGISSGYTLYASNWSGTYYIKVRPYNNSNSNKGTFALFAP